MFCGLLHPDDQNFFQNGMKNVSLSKDYPSAYWVAFLGIMNLQNGLIEDINQIIPFYMYEFPI